MLSIDSLITPIYLNPELTFVQVIVSMGGLTKLNKHFSKDRKPRSVCYPSPPLFFPTPPDFPVPFLSPPSLPLSYTIDPLFLSSNLRGNHIVAGHSLSQSGSLPYDGTTPK